MKTSLYFCILLTSILVSGCASHWDGPISPYDDRRFVTHLDNVFTFDLLVEGRPLSRELPPKFVDIVHSIQCEDTKICKAFIDRSESNHRVTIIPLKEGVTKIQTVSVHPTSNKEYRLEWPLRVTTREVPMLDLGVKLVSQNSNPTSLMYHGVKQKYFCQDSLKESEMSPQLNFASKNSSGRLVLVCHPKREFRYSPKDKFFDYARSAKEQDTLKLSDVVACLVLDANREILGYRLYYKGRLSDKFAPGKIKGADSFERCDLEK